MHDIDTIEITMTIIITILIIMMMTTMINLENMRPEMPRIIPRRASSGPLWTRV